MSLTERGYADRQWGNFPEIRQVLETRRPSEDNYLSSAAYRRSERLPDLITIATLVIENSEALSSIDVEAGQRDLHRLVDELMDHLRVVRDLSEAVRAAADKCGTSAMASRAS